MLRKLSNMMNNIKNKISYFLWHNWVVDKIEDTLFKLANYVWNKRRPPNRHNPKSKAK